MFLNGSRKIPRILAKAVSVWTRWHSFGISMFFNAFSTVKLSAFKLMCLDYHLRGGIKGLAYFNILSYKNHEKPQSGEQWYAEKQFYGKQSNYIYIWRKIKNFWKENIENYIWTSPRFKQRMKSKSKPRNRSTYERIKYSSIYKISEFAFYDYVNRMEDNKNVKTIMKWNPIHTWKTKLGGRMM